MGWLIKSKFSKWFRSYEKEYREKMISKMLNILTSALIIQLLLISRTTTYTLLYE
jgi:hypothetical protein